VNKPTLNGEDFKAQAWPFFWLTRSTALYLSRLERSLKKVGLDIARWRVLMCVGPEDAIGISEIADLAIVKLPTMMKIIQRMEADGMVNCRPREEDGRFTDVTLTEQGIAAREQAWAMAQKIYEKAFANISSAENAALNKSLSKIVASLEEE
jgi:DNA-binding MarR family transcriptional regulator